MKIMIGLLGNPKESKKMDSGLLDEGGECPLATQDEIVNRGNKQKAILTASYGPAEDEEKCGNCEYAEKLKGCKLGKAEVFCELFEFKAAEDHVCNAHEPEEEDESEDE